MNTAPEHIINVLPDRAAAERFLEHLAGENPLASRKLLKNEALLSDVLTLVTYSPLLATTLLHNPEYIQWLNKHRLIHGVRGKDEMSESLARFALTHSTLPHQVLFARFRRRELLRIYLADIRRQATVSETTEQLSNLADAILETALRTARQEMDNRFGGPLEPDEKGRRRNAEFCVVSLGKLGSRELNYSSDIDLLFLYSGEGETSGSGTRGTVSNREYFVKLAEFIIRMIGQQTGGGATYRVDLRLRPHGRVGPLAMSAADTARYYTGEARDWERQVLIRSRASAGDLDLFRRFYEAVEPSVFSESQSVPAALRSVRASKQKIDFKLNAGRTVDVKLGRGGIREIEFVAQALQLAHGGGDRWLRSSHTLISLARLADRGLLADDELSQLFEAYDFLRRLEHILQMENGLQTHLVPADSDRRRLVALRMRFGGIAEFDAELHRHTDHVRHIFDRIFSDQSIESAENPPKPHPPGSGGVRVADDLTGPAVRLLEPDGSADRFRILAAVSPKYAQMIAADPSVTESDIPGPGEFEKALADSVLAQRDLGARLSSLRRRWKGMLIDIAARDAAGEITTREAKRRQTMLAEATISAAIGIAASELANRYDSPFDKLSLAVMGLGKLGGAGIDYDSDLDVILIYDEMLQIPVAATEFYARAVESFVNALSGITRDGSLYRVDLRLRPHGQNGPNCISARSFANYVARDAAIWELLAFLKIRAAGGCRELASTIEHEIVSIILQRSAQVPPEQLASETLRIRRSLELQRTAADRRGVIDIKYGPGGMLDIYFAARYLQLRDGVLDQAENRSTDQVLDRLAANGSLSSGHHVALIDGYQFISELDHAIRLSIGRNTKLPASSSRALAFAAERLGLRSADDLISNLAIHRVVIRETFEEVVR